MVLWYAYSYGVLYSMYGSMSIAWCTWYIPTMGTVCMPYSIHLYTVWHSVMDMPYHITWHVAHDGMVCHMTWYVLYDMVTLLGGIVLHTLLVHGTVGCILPIALCTGCCTYHHTIYSWHCICIIGLWCSATCHQTVCRGRYLHMSMPWCPAQDNTTGVVAPGYLWEGIGPHGCIPVPTRHLIQPQ